MKSPTTGERQRGADFFHTIEELVALRQELRLENGTGPGFVHVDGNTASIFCDDLETFTVQLYNIVAKLRGQGLLAALVMLRKQARWVADLRWFETVLAERRNDETAFIAKVGDHLVDGEAQLSGDVILLRRALLEDKNVSKALMGGKGVHKAAILATMCFRGISEGTIRNAVEAVANERARIERDGPRTFNVEYEIEGWDIKTKVEMPAKRRQRKHGESLGATFTFGPVRRR